MLKNEWLFIAHTCTRIYGIILYFSWHLLILFFKFLIRRIVQTCTEGSHKLELRTFYVKFILILISIMNIMNMMWHGQILFSKKHTITHNSHWRSFNLIVIAISLIASLSSYWLPYQTGRCGKGNKIMMIRSSE